MEQSSHFSVFMSETLYFLKKSKAKASINIISTNKNNMAEYASFHIFQNSLSAWMFKNKQKGWQFLGKSNGKICSAIPPSMLTQKEVQLSFMGNIYLQVYLGLHPLCSTSIWIVGLTHIFDHRRTTKGKKITSPHHSFCRSYRNKSSTWTIIDPFFWIWGVFLCTETSITLAILQSHSHFFLP